MLFNANVASPVCPDPDLQPPQQQHVECAMMVPVPELSPNTLSAINENIPSEAFTDPCEELFRQLPESNNQLNDGVIVDLAVPEQPEETFSHPPLPQPTPSPQGCYQQQPLFLAQPQQPMQQPVPTDLVFSQPQQIALMAPPQQVFAAVPQQAVILTPATALPTAVVVCPPQHPVQPAPAPPTAVSQLDAIDKASEGVDIDEVRDLVAAFKRKRLSLGLNQTRVGSDIEDLVSSCEELKGNSSSSVFPSYSQSQICRIERLDITPRQAKAITPVLQKWLLLADTRHISRVLAGGKTTVSAAPVDAVANSSSVGRKRRVRTHFSSEAVSKLKAFFAEDPLPNQFRLEEISKNLELDYRAVRVWFCNRRQSLKNDAVAAQKKHHADEDLKS